MVSRLKPVNCVICLKWSQDWRSNRIIQIDKLLHMERKSHCSTKIYNYSMPRTVSYDNDIANVSLIGTTRFWYYVDIRAEKQGWQFAQSTSADVPVYPRPYLKLSRKYYLIIPILINKSLIYHRQFQLKIQVRLPKLKPKTWLYSDIGSQGKKKTKANCHKYYDVFFLS